MQNPLWRYSLPPRPTAGWSACAKLPGQEVCNGKPEAAFHKCSPRNTKLGHGFLRLSSFLAEFKNAHADEHGAAADCGGHDIVRPMRLNVRRYASGAACGARAEFHYFVSERRSPSGFPTFGSQCNACRSRRSRIETKDNSDVYFPKPSGLKAAVNSIVC